MQAQALEETLLKQTSFRQFSSEQGLSQNTVNHFLEDHQGYIWVATDSGLNRLEGNRVVQYLGPGNELQSSQVNSVTEDSKGNLWVAAFEELLSFSPDRTRVESYQLPIADSQADLSSNFVLQIFEESDDYFWIVTGQGIIGLQPESKDLQPFPAMQLLIDDGVRINSALNSGRNIWLATTAGLYRFDKANLTLESFQLPPQLDNAWLHQVVELSPGQLAVASYEGLVLVDTQANQTEDAQIISQVSVNALAKLNGRIVYAEDDSLFHYDPKSQTRQHLFAMSEILPRFSEYKIIRLFVDQQNKLWIGTESQGAYLWEPDSLKFKTLEQLYPKAGITLSSSQVWGITESGSETLWIATSSGVNRVALEDGKSDSFLTKGTAGLSAAQSNIFFQLLDGERVWLGTADGLIRLLPENGEFEIFRPETIRANQDFFIYSMARDPSGTLWLATDKGPTSFDPDTGAFSIPRGLTARDYQQESTFIRFMDDKLWIGYRDKLVTYDPVTQQLERVFKFGHIVNAINLSLTDLHKDGSRLWVSFTAAGIYVLELGGDNTQVVKRFERKSGFIDNTVHSLLYSQGNIWASSHSGIIRINPETFEFQVFDYYDGLPTNEFNEGARFKMHDDRLMFGGVNGVLVLDPTDLPQPDSQQSAVITQVDIDNRQLPASGIDWAERDLTLSPKENLISFRVSVLDYLAPHKWRYEYWLTGEIESQPRFESDNKISFGNLTAGDYQLNIRPVNPNLNIQGKVTRIPFRVERATTPYLLFQIAIGLIIFATLFSLIVRLRKRHSMLETQNLKLQEKEHRLRLALLDKRRGIWDWNNQGDSPEDSRLTIMMSHKDDLMVSLAEYQSFVHRDDLSKTQHQWLAFIEGDSEEISQVFRINLFDTWIWCRMNGTVSLKHSSGRPLRATGTWFDISREKEAEEKLKLYEKAIESTRDVIFILDNDLNILAINQAYETLTGYSSDKLIGLSLLSIAEKRFNKELAKELFTQIKQQHSWQGESTMPIKDSPSYPIDVRIDAFDPDNEQTEYIMVMTDISLLSARMESQISSSYYDNLTGLPNKILAGDRLSHALNHARQYHSNVCMLQLEIDNFDQLRKHHGKSVARKRVVNISQRINKVLNKDDTLARVDKQSFQIILENVESPENISLKIDSILRQLSVPIASEENDQPAVSASIGAAFFPADAQSPGKLAECSLSALEQAKTAGGGQIHYFQKEMNKRAADRIAMKNSLYQAIENKEFFLVFQPQFDLNTRALTGFEVFMRWRTSEGNIIYPSQFIRIAEEVGAIESLTAWLIDKSFKTLNQWRQEGINTVFSINLIPEYCGKIGAPDYLVEKLNQYELSPVNIQIEINEKHFSNNPTTSVSFIEELTQRGISVTIDDFGTGNTPLSVLKNLPSKAIKLDRTFIRSIGKDRNNDALLRSIIQMSLNLGQNPSAKSIEYESQVEFLIGCGCHIGQGYFFSDPLTESGARQFMLTRNQS